MINWKNFQEVAVAVAANEARESAVAEAEDVEEAEAERGKISILKNREFFFK